MNIGNPVDRRLPWVRTIHDLDEARAVSTPGSKVQAMRRAGERLGDDLRDRGQVVSVRTLPRVPAPYPTRFAFNGACRSRAPYVIIHNKALLVQVQTDGGIKNVLFNPTDYMASRETPFFKQLGGRYSEPLANWITEKQGHDIVAELGALGLTPEDIDVVCFDHFHTQDLRPLLGSSEPDASGHKPQARFPNAYLLAPRREWLDWDDLHPMQRPWFIADGKKGVPSERIVLTDGDLALGQGCMLLQTPGHTSGNQTLFVHGERGVFGCCENGTSADSWAPRESRIPGLRQYARYYDAEVVLNSNTPEMGAEQYTSMILERSVVDRVPDAPQFVQMFPSSELTPSVLNPRVRPTMMFYEQRSGTVQGRGTQAAAAAERPTGAAAHPAE